MNEHRLDSFNQALKKQFERKTMCSPSVIPTIPTRIIIAKYCLPVCLSVRLNEIDTEVI